MLLAIVLCASVLGHDDHPLDPWAGMGELTIYWSETQNGTIAKRDLRNPWSASMPPVCSHDQKRI
jgi:hypothetical protein